MADLFELPPRPTLPVSGEASRFPVNRIFCVGRNYEAHAREMGLTPHRDGPIYFTKSPTAVCPSGETIAYPLRTGNCHYEVELVVAVGKPAFRIAEEAALSIVLGYACGLDMTRRDLQVASRNEGQPWDTGKDFEHAAVLGAIRRAESFGQPGRQRITLSQNGEVRQDALIEQMIWSVPELISDLSTLYRLAPGDLIFTGTPAGVGPVAPGDALTGRVEGLEEVTLTIGDPE